MTWLNDAEIKTAEDKQKENLDLERVASNKANQEYLDSTDWMIIRKYDAGIAVPAGVKKARSDARNAML